MRFSRIQARFSARGARPAAATLRRMSIRDWPSATRPREKLLEFGPQALSDAELLAVLFRTGVAGSSAVELAQRLLAEFQSLRALLSAEPRDAIARREIGLARYATLQASLELARRHYREVLRAGPALTAPEATRAFLTAQLRDRGYEVFCCLYLDNRHRLIAFEELFRGTIDGASVHPREDVRQALARNAAALIVAHNHPLCGIRVSPPWGCVTRQGPTGQRAGRVLDGSTVR